MGASMSCDCCKQTIECDSPESSIAVWEDKGSETMMHVCHTCWHNPDMLRPHLDAGLDRSSYQERSSWEILDEENQRRNRVIDARWAEKDREHQRLTGSKEGWLEAQFPPSKLHSCPCGMDTVLHPDTRACFGCGAAIEA